MEAKTTLYNASKKCSNDCKLFNRLFMEGKWMHELASDNFIGKPCEVSYTFEKNSLQNISL